MKITNLDISRYKRFFAFGCSFTNYIWPTWADIISQDIPVYENWGKPGAGNHYIFNSLMEAHSRHKFNKDDLVIVMWSTKEREDRYNNNEWIVAGMANQEKVYGRNWFKKFGIDIRGYLIRDLALIKASHSMLKSCECDWENFTLNPTTNIDDNLVIKAGYDLNKISEKEGFEYWVRVFDDLCDGKEIDPLVEYQDVINIYKDIFLDINKSFEGRWSYEYKKSRISPNNDVHPTPLEALEFLDNVWPNNNLSQKSRDYAMYWNEQIFKHKRMNSPIHQIQEVTRL